MFEPFNQDVIAAFIGNKRKIAENGADRRVRALLDEVGATAFNLLPHPFLFPADDFDRLARIARDLLSAQNKIVRHLCRQRSRADILEQFSLDEALAPYVDWEELEAGRRRVARVDILPLPEGYAVCELNFSAAVGGAELFDCYRQFMQAAGWPAGERNRSPYANLRALYEDSIQSLGIDRLVLLDWSSHAARGYASPELARRYLAGIADDMPIEVHTELTYPSKWLGDGGGKGMLVHRNFVYDDITVNIDKFEAIHRSGAKFSNGLEAELLMNKIWLALLCDAHFHPLLDEREIAAIRDYIPYTFRLDESTLADALARKDEWVFKLNASYGGVDVLIGKDHPAEALANRLRKGGVTNWVCQAFREVATIRHPFDDTFVATEHRPVLGMYLHRDKASGMVIRSNRFSSVVNAGSGAGVHWAAVATQAEKEAVLAALDG
ncbi:hypothetical protein [Burkholderia oklahomensis]|uniref:Glutathionylspermidine synthase n=1 Tax=Burkholderia oklahomensis TaxID=342113 RepID=A0AAI8FQX1_9BURK|nr:hypothetical protein [Burkholderia oklahomensis]AIO70126.1 hypothetical protein DM82_5232 [Burkholderia oklahomensis]AOI39343.1 hypothetical protein WG70_06720 [Burkholderia oklahomensis EO147]KUY47849.1 hypothetical protein WG70_22105 [Burkholderia oklahomensis EO147]QPS40304.1 hypothetical protein I6G57_31635 [Burkholderia oklahomensis]